MIEDTMMDETRPVTIEQVEAMLAEQFPPIPEPARFPGDPSATWDYWTLSDTVERGVPEEWVWDRLRLRRNTLLAECDFRVVADAPWDTAPWLTYRQALRDLPDTTTDPRLAVWPEPPA